MKKLSWITLIALVIFPSCNNPEPSENQMLNEWIWDGMNDVYLWADDINQSLYPVGRGEAEPEPEDFFYSLLNSADRFSWIVDDIQALLDQFNNTGLSSGISPAFIKYGETEVLVVPRFVTPGSPADLAGVKRGDLIVKINDQMLNTSNYSDLFYGTDLTLGFADAVGDDIVPNSRVVSFSAADLSINPVHHHELIEHAGTKVGYVVYTDFTGGETDDWLDSLRNVFTDLQSQGAEEYIIDLRYNGGGYIYVAQYLATMLLPMSVPTDNPLVRQEWNSYYQEAFTTVEGEDSPNLVVPFDDSPDLLRLDLSNIYFLTGRRSASASELIIIGLDPYMNVVTIGESTYGKFVGSFTIGDTETPARHSWAMQPIVFKYANADGFTDFNDGLMPDVPVGEDYYNLYPFGDLEDPILTAALEEITGVSPSAKKSIALERIQEQMPLFDPVQERKMTAIQRQRD